MLSNPEIDECFSQPSASGYGKSRYDIAKEIIATYEKKLYPLPDSLYPGSKDWLAGGYKERVEWLHQMYEASKEETDEYLDQLTLKRRKLSYPKAQKAVLP